MDDHLSSLFEIQKRFSDEFFDSESLTLEEREEKTKSFALALHNEISSLVSEINFKSHDSVRKDVVRNCLLYEGIDVFRYLLAIMNLWGFSSDEFVEAFHDKESYLQSRYLGKKEWDGRPVVIFDMDDVLTEFRDTFAEWLNTTQGLNVNPKSTEYYLLKDLSKQGRSSEGLFSDFIENHYIKSLAPVEGSLDVLRELNDRGFWIQIVTARPESNRRCFYDTYTWLKNNNVTFHDIAFTPEKTIWLSKTDFFSQGAVVCAVEDSTKHAMEYVKHGIPVVSPVKSYNQELHQMGGVETYENSQEMLSKILRCVNT